MDSCGKIRSPAILDQFNAHDAAQVYALARSNTHIGNKVSSAINILEKCLDDYDGLQEVALSFNGGKDCTVVVHILAAVVYNRYNLNNDSNHSLSNNKTNGHNQYQQQQQETTPSHTPPHPGNINNNQISSSPSSSSSLSFASSPLKQQDHQEEKTQFNTHLASSKASNNSIQTLYVRCQSPFPQLEEFIYTSSYRYNLNIVCITADMKQALVKYTQEGNPGNNIKAVIVGTRLTDPHGEYLKPFSPTDVGWPSLMRVHPILDWSHADVWEFLRSPSLSPQSSSSTIDHKTSSLPENSLMTTPSVYKRSVLPGVGWCSLYNYGYTSLGSTHNTFPNPYLASSDEPSGWKPAWELVNESQERAGRERR